MKSTSVPTTLFISDLHLSPDHPDMTALFLKWLKNEGAQAEALYILGDFFEAWIGDDDHSDFIDTIKQALKSITQSGTPIYFMHGNRDFLLGKRFMQDTGCQLLSDPTVINLYGMPTLLTHGDGLCLADKGYLRFRRVVRNGLFQKLYLMMPLSWRRNIANFLRNQSQGQMVRTQLIDADSGEIARLLAYYKAQAVIHGHTHRPSLELNYGKQPYFRAVLSDWDDTEGCQLICAPEGTNRLKKIKF